MLHVPLCWTITSMLLSHLCLTFKLHSSTHISWPIFCKQSSFQQFTLQTCPHQSYSLPDPKNAWCRSRNNDCTHYLIFSILPSLPFDYTQISFSKPLYLSWIHKLSVRDAGITIKKTKRPNPISESILHKLIFFHQSANTLPFMEPKFHYSVQKSLPLFCPQPY